MLSAVIKIINTVDILQRMVDAVERVRQRLLLASKTLNDAGVRYAVVGGNAVAAWVASVDPGAVRNTQDVDIMIRRDDLPAARAAMERAGFVHAQDAGVDMFMDSAIAGPRHAVHVIFANERIKAHEPFVNPDVADSADIGNTRFLDLDALVRVKLAVNRDKDRTHVRDMIGVGLVDASWLPELPPPLAARLQELLDTPDG